jgi:hypothetical protein
MTLLVVLNLLNKYWILGTTCKVLQYKVSNCYDNSSLIIPHLQTFFPTSVTHVNSTFFSHLPATSHFSFPCNCSSKDSQRRHNLAFLFPQRQKPCHLPTTHLSFSSLAIVPPKHQRRRHNFAFQRYITSTSHHFHTTPAIE